MDQVDWVVCNSGADIWHNIRDGSSDKAGWHADEAWEEHINFRRVHACTHPPMLGHCAVCMCMPYLHQPLCPYSQVSCPAPVCVQMGARHVRQAGQQAALRQ